jgi:hypothetical protein
MACVFNDLWSDCLEDFDEAIMGFTGRPGADQPIKRLDVEGGQAGLAEQTPPFGFLEPGQMDRLEEGGLESLADLPGLEELKGAGLLSNRLPPNMQIPLPFDGPLREDEDPLDPDDIEGRDEEE